MRSGLKAAAICSSIAVLSLGASMSVMAAQSGWMQEGEVWCWLDSSGSKVTDTWKKSGNNWYYLDSNGEMAVSQWVEDTSYVDENGVRAANRWVQVDAGTDNAPNSDGGWYYIDTAGKSVTDGWKTINGKKYYFDSDGTMKYGWFTDSEDTYYLGSEDEGAAKTGWLCLDFDPDNPPEESAVSNVESSGGDTAKWFYFQSNGKAVKSLSDTYASRTINGNKYYFDGNGVMLTGWISMASGSEAETSDPTGISGFKYFGGDDDGKMSKGWRYMTDGPEDSDDSSSITTATSSNADSYGDQDGSWYYFDSSGTPKYLNAEADSMSKATSRINGQTYFFDEYGRMQYGLLGITFGDGTTDSAYFGSSDADGKMKTDKQSSVTEDNGDKSTFYFDTSGGNKGAGYTGEKKGYLYYYGKLVKADTGSTTQVFEVNSRIYLVNESGKIQSSNKVYKSDGDYRFEYNNGTVYYVDTDKNREGEVTSGEKLPEIAYKTIYSL